MIYSLIAFIVGLVLMYIRAIENNMKWAGIYAFCAGLNFGMLLIDLIRYLK